MVQAGRTRSPRVLCAPAIRAMYAARPAPVRLSARSPRRALAVAATLLAGLAFARPAAAGLSEALVRQCERELAPARIEVRVDLAPVQHDFTRSLIELGRAHPPGRAGYVTTGLTLRELQTQARWSDSAFALPDGMGCLRPDVSITLAFVRHTVYVAREFPPGSCAHHETLEHERTHVQLNERQAAEAARVLRERLRAFFGQRIFYGELATLRAQLGEALQSDWLPWLDALLAGGQAEHAAFDKHQLDEAIRACPKEKQQLLRAARQRVTAPVGRNPTSPEARSL